MLCPLMMCRIDLGEGRCGPCTVGSGVGVLRSATGRCIDWRCAVTGRLESGLAVRIDLCYRFKMNALVIAISANILLGFVLLGMLFRRRAADAERLTDSDQALCHIRRLLPSADGNVSLSADGLGALFELLDGTVGLIERRGRRWTVRVIEPGELVAVQVEGDRITIRFADFGWPRSYLQLPDPAIRRHWDERLAALLRATPARYSAGGHCA